MDDFNNDYLWDTPEETELQVIPEESNYDFNPEDDSYYGDSDDNTPEESEEPENQTTDFISRTLRNKGIDREKVRIQNDKGEIEEWKFDDLDEDTKYGILNTEEELPLTDEEINTVNFLRNQKMTLPELLEYQKQQAIKEYLELAQDNKNYTVDLLSDDELFKFDLLDQTPDLTEEEVEEQLQRAKENESFFNKRIASLRQEYKDLQDQQEQDQKKQEEDSREQAFQSLASQYVLVARDLDEINGMELDDDDREEVLSFMLDRDANGLTQFYKLFSDPEKAFRIAWYALKGEEAYNALTDYYLGEISKARRTVKQELKPLQKTVRRSKTSKDPDDLRFGLDGVFS